MQTKFSFRNVNLGHVFFHFISKLLSYVLKAGVSTIILITNILENHVYFRSYVDLKIRKVGPKYSFGDGNSLKFRGDFPTLTLTILKLNA